MSEPEHEPVASLSDNSLSTATADEDLLAVLADEFSARLRRGEHPQVEEYVAKHPDLAERIRKVLEAIALMEQSRAIDYAGASERVGDIIGRYKLLERIGEGGFGVVYMAEQQQPVRRKVALKVVKPGMDSRQVLARFEAERQALAIMDHPNIAKVFDVGATDSGRPYFVMELVRGEPITEFCDRNQLSPRERLELFAQVCHAVQHAHQKGIIHRDIKPTNVLVAMHDTTPVVKVIDFGVSKALGQELTEKTLFTGFAQLLGTPLYMSPEQAGQSALDIDTRSDIYSLGVLLYELLTGTTPFDKERFKQAAQNEICRIIREEEPPKPSTRLSESKESLPSISAQRQMEPSKLTKLVRGELDWIVMKALEKDRTRRYETASGMARDIERYLHDEPVEACPPSSAYRIKKFVQRNKGTVLAAGLVLLTLIGGIAGTSFGLVRAEQARLAEIERAEGERLARQEAQAVLDFVEQKVFAAARPEGMDGGLGHNVTLRRAIETALPFLDADFADRPLIEARLRGTLGETFRALGEENLAAEQFNKAIALYTKHRGPNHPDMFKSTIGLARSYDDLGRRAEALGLLENLLVHCKSQLGLDHPDTLACMYRLAAIYNHLGRYVEALKLDEETFTLRKAKLGSDHPDTLRSMRNLANEYDSIGRLSESVKLIEETLPLMIDKFGPNHIETLICKSNLANSYCRFNRNDEALKLYQEVLKSAKSKLGLAHPITLRQMRALAITYDNVGRHAEATKLYEETIALMKANLGPDDDRTLNCRDLLSFSYSGAGEFADAVRISDESLSLRRAKFGADHPTTLGSMNSLARYYTGLGRHSEALKLREEQLAIHMAKHGPDHADTLSTVNEVLTAYKAFGPAKLDESVDKYRKAIENEPRAAGENRQILGLMLHQQGKFDEAIVVCRNAIEVDPRDARSFCTLGLCLRDQGKPDEALAAFSKGIEFNPNNPKLREVRAAAYAAMGQWDKAEDDYEKQLQLNPTDQWPWYFRGCILAYLGRNEEYGEHCRAMLTQFAETADYGLLERTTRSALLMPEGVKGNMDRVIRHVDLACARWPQMSWSMLLKGMAECRAGRYEVAAGLLEKCRAVPSEDYFARTGLVTAEAYLGVARHRLGQVDEARAALDRATERATKIWPAVGSIDWSKIEVDHWLIAHTAMREAKLLILGRQATALAQ